jgi:nitrate/TMAO reductase-like tetraheme cytochrome c subunit
MRNGSRQKKATVGISSFARRRKGLLLSLGIIIAVGYIGVNLLAYSLTYKPEACLTCHIMKPYYDNWKSSSHNKIGCIDCHPYRPSTIILSSVRYLSGTYRLPLKSSVEDKECILCHKPESTKIVNFRGTPFNHLEHIRKSKRGKNLHCTSCHYSVVQSKTHMDVDVGVCTLCHFYTTPPQYNQNCIVCHGRQRKELKIGEVNFSHESFLTTGARCIECHSQTVTGIGDAPEERCRDCHMEPKTDGRDTTRLHEIHIANGYVNCFKCHTRMEHGKETIHFSRAIDLSCSECHSSSHSAPRDMYMGIGSQSVKDSPSAMYVSRVRCTGCHTLEKSIHGKQVLSKSWEAKKKSCVLCHKPGYDKMVEDLKKGMTAFTDSLAKLVDQYGKALEERKSPAALVDAYRATERDLQFLKEGRGEHNVRYAFEIGKAIVSDVQQGYKKIGVSQKLTIPDQIAKADGFCTFCHATFQPDKELRVKVLKNIKFGHAQHVEMGTECTKCHDQAQHRLGTGLRTAACKECHQDKAF